MNTRVAPSTYTTKDYYNYNDKADYPPMPPYNPYARQQGPGTYAHYNPSAATLGYDDPNYPSSHAMYDEADNESTMHLAAAAAPFARDPIDRQGSPYTAYDPRDVYQGRSPSVAPQQQQQQQYPHGRSPPPPFGQVPGVYDDGGQYGSAYPSQGPPPGGDPYGGGYAPRRHGYDEEVGGYGRGQGGQQRPM